MLTVKTYTVITDDGKQRIHEHYHDTSLFGFRIFRRITEVRRSAANIAADVRRVVFAIDDQECVYCAKAGEAIDHVVPQVQHGLSSIFNLVLACRSCNSQKSGRTPIEAGMVPRYGRFRLGVDGAPLRAGYPNHQSSIRITLPLPIEKYTYHEAICSEYFDDDLVDLHWRLYVINFNYGEPFNSAFIACEGRIPFLYS